MKIKIEFQFCKKTFFMTLLDRFNVIHVNFMIMLKKRKKKLIRLMLSMTMQY